MFYATHWALGDAEQYFLEAVKLRTEVHGRQSLETLQTLHEMGLFYLSCCQWEKSITVFEDIVGSKRALSGQDDLSVAECVSVLARLYAHIGLFSYAKECLTEMKRIRAECFIDVTDKETCDSHLSTGIVLRSLGDLKGCSLEFGLAVRREHFEHLPTAHIIYFCLFFCVIYAPSINIAKFHHANTPFLRCARLLNTHTHRRWKGVTRPSKTRRPICAIPCCTMRCPSRSSGTSINRNVHSRS
jgi:hypothetical protein